jgi:hypothetical protein
MSAGREDIVEGECRRRRWLADRSSPMKREWDCEPTDIFLFSFLQTPVSILQRQCRGERDVKSLIVTLRAGRSHLKKMRPEDA